MITLCLNCLLPIYRYRGTDWWVHSETGNHWCAHKFEVATFGIEAWETEDAQLVVTGTPSPGHAALAAMKMYKDAGAWGDTMMRAMLDTLPTQPLRWVNRNHPAYEAERWPDDVVSEVRRPGDSPLLAMWW